MAVKREATDYSVAVADVILGLYKAKRWNQARLAKRSGIKEGTLRRMIAGESEISARDLSLLAAVLGTTPQEILDQALREYGGLEALVSEVAVTTDDLDAKRKEKARSLTIEEIETEDAAATRDPELDADEP
jgi:transcriptional regulator with XRE-family HTH domain